MESGDAHMNIQRFTARISNRRTACSAPGRLRRPAAARRSASAPAARRAAGGRRPPAPGPASTPGPSLRRTAPAPRPSPPGRRTRPPRRAGGGMGGPGDGQRAPAGQSLKRTKLKRLSVWRVAGVNEDPGEKLWKRTLEFLWRLIFKALRVVSHFTLWRNNRKNKKNVATTLDWPFQTKKGSTHHQDQLEETIWQSFIGKNDF